MSKIKLTHDTVERLKELKKEIHYTAGPFPWILEDVPAVYADRSHQQDIRCANNNFYGEVTRDSITALFVEAGMFVLNSMPDED